MRKVMKYTISLACIILGLNGLNSCVEEAELQSNSEVHLQGSLVPSNIFTKATVVPGVLDPSYNGNLTIGLARIDEGDPGYPLFTNTTQQLEAEMIAGDTDPNLRDISFKKYQQFKNVNNKVKYASWYPYGNFNAEDKSITTAIDGNLDIMYGDIATGNQKKGFNTIYFNHALSKFTFHVYAMVQEDFTQEDLNRIWGKLKDITIEGLATDCKITLPVTKHDEYKVEYLGEKPENRVNIAKTGAYLLESLPIGAGNATQLPSLIAAPPSNGELKVLITTENQSVSNQTNSKTMTIARNFKAGKNYDIYLRFSDYGIINAEVALGEWQNGPDVDDNDATNMIYYDLSTTEHANSYVVTSANYNYCFDVSTKGNGEIGDLNGEGVKMTPGWADIVWMDSNLKPYVQLSTNEVIQNRILFKVTNEFTGTDPSKKSLSAEGNVLFGVWDKNPADGGNLLWTWHIWLTDFPEKQAYKNGFVAIDRDLGATAARVSEAELKADAEAYKQMDGLYYQWGRPTPLPLGRTTIKKDGQAFSITDNMTSAPLQERITHPEYFYTDQTAINSRKDFMNIWGYTLSSLEYKKSIYDPCPPGYRMPGKSLFTHVDYKKSRLDINHGHSLVMNVDSYYKMDNVLSGFYENSTTKHGYHVGAQNIPGTYDGAYCWTATLNLTQTPKPEYYSPYSLDCLIEKGKVATDGILAKAAVQTARDLSHALPVRCVSQRSMPETRDLSAYQTANCYILDKTGYYKFKATVRGNGVNELVSPGSSTSIDITENVPPDISNKIFKVVPLWWQGDLSTTEGNPNGDPDTYGIPVEFILDGLVNNEGYVTLRLNDNRKGNLIVAGKDQHGKILWTWHLWLTEKPGDHSSNDFAVMDRFLGATYLPTLDSKPTENQILASIGFFYQWSRKDPFPGPTQLNGSSAGSDWWKYDETKPEGERWIAKKGIESNTKVNAEKTVLESVEHPTRFHATVDELFPGGTIFKEWIKGYYGKVVSTAGQKRENQCFPTAKHPSNMWGYSSFGGAFGRTTTKTMYDPCPPGYSVAYYLVWTNADINNPYNIYTEKDAGVIEAGSKVINKNYGFFLNHNDFGKTWYPYSGYIESKGTAFREVGSAGWFHSSTPVGASSRSLFYYKDANGTVWTGQATDMEYHGVPSTYAYPVRCQKD